MRIVSSPLIASFTVTVGFWVEPLYSKVSADDVTILLVIDFALMVRVALTLSAV